MTYLSSHQRHSRSPRNTSRGFSLVELIVSISILGIITTLLLAKNSEFNGNILLTNLAYDTALAIRESQIYGLSVKEAGLGTGNFTYAYGVNFSTSDFLSFTSFVDRNNNGLKGPTEGLETHLIERGNSIAKFCVMDLGTERCSDTGTIQELNITFLRPDPRALVRAGTSQLYSGARIYLTSPRGNQKVVVVESTGQISIR